MQVRGTDDAGRGMSLMSRSSRAGLLRRLLEVAGWVFLVSVLWGTDLLVKIAERDQTGFGKDDFRLITEQVTSGIAVLIMVSFVIRWLRVFPLKRDAWAPAIVGHTFGSVVFAAGHYVLMVLMRMVVYGLAGITYVWREPFFSNLVLEYQKDIKIYVGIIAVIIAYRRLSRDDGRDAVASDREGRLLVQTGSGSTVLRFTEIEYLEAARNYVAIHAGGREYLVRDTMANIEVRLPRATFVRTHRSYIVNIDRISEIRTVDSKQCIALDSGAEVPLSRTYRETFRNAVASP